MVCRSQCVDFHNLRQWWSGYSCMAWQQRQHDLLVLHVISAASHNLSDITVGKATSASLLTMDISYFRDVQSRYALPIESHLHAL